MARLEQSVQSRILAGYPRKALPLLAVNHISFAVPQPRQTANFFEKVLGFKRLRRPAAIADRVDGAWVCGMGLEIHFVEPSECNLARKARRAHSRKGIDTRNDHLSFLCTDDTEDSGFERIMQTLEQSNVEYATYAFPEDNLKQLFFCEPSSGILIEVSTNPKC
ncbi:hypothetical protein BWQ96_04835 [Gracilariopsis chorda]|uniref:Glyoxalase/fosfomycin resistance/dioxygenase domain-containing protein n=1 Tax=Gracilariopsis chorda TaxID=448386 RepID=A0A2V3IWA8_9FLOR|nr:hypothetical protein BWQ96_04835 [Gracilariopsis chorda]|eukprot:PXF45420.1 hypothetical protein BWQ96_04835 [Gracilariopsis chorda]